MSFALQKINPSCSAASSTSARGKSLEFPFKPVTTKAEKYAELVRFDQCKLKRQKAHFKNALKTTEGLDKVAKQLERNLSKLDAIGSRPISFDRLAVCRIAFEKVIELNEACAPELRKIMAVYNEYVLHMLSQQNELPRPHKYTPLVSSGQRSTPQDDRQLTQLRHRLHQLEVEARVVLQEHQRLSEETREAIAFHSTEMERIHHEGRLAMEVTTKAMTGQGPTQGYLEQVDFLQSKIAERCRAIDAERCKRKGYTPLSVYHNIEQCLREVEIDTLKSHRQNQLLRKKIEKSKAHLKAALQQQGLQINSDLQVTLGF